ASPIPTDFKDGGRICAGTPEAAAYEKVVVLAHRTAPEALAHSADQSASVAELLARPGPHRGKAVSLAGRLVRVSRGRLSGAMAAEGVADVYEAWVVTEGRGAHLACVVFTAWPDGLPRDLLGRAVVGSNIHVAFSAFFLKKFRCTPERAREAPLLVA